MDQWQYLTRPGRLPAEVGVLELAVFRTGLVRNVEYWMSMGIVLAFLVIVGGWLTKLSPPIGVRFPPDIAVAAFLFGFALVTAALMLRERQR